VARLSEIKLLENRRRQLLAESERLRHQLRAEIGQLQATTGWLKVGFSLLQSARSYWPLVVAGTGFLLTRKRSGPLSLFDKIWSVWRIAKKLINFWQQYSSEASPPAQTR
jgi:hypothetical protein